MGPKKREKETASTDVAAVNSAKTIVTGSKIDTVQADHELFLQAFEKPTQIYRYLRTRHLLSPVFLHRSLSYMKGRISGRDHKKRKTFKVDSILETKTKEFNNGECGVSKYMTLTFLGFYDAKEESQEAVRVETLLLKIGHKKRKDVSSPIMQISFGTTDVCVNPKEDDTAPPKAPTISISTEDISIHKATNNHQGNSYVLLLRVQPPEGFTEEPAPKRRRLSDQASQPAGQENSIRLFGAELIIYDKHNRCLLVDGDYELALQQLNSSEPQSRRSSGQHGQQSTSTSWNSFSASTVSPKTFLAQGPTLKFRLQWADQPVSPLVDRPKPYASCGQEAAVSESREELKDLKESIDRKDDKISVRYQFLYHGNRRQQTEARHDLHCPWCSLHCRQLPSLLKHLRLCHPRFIFAPSITTSGAVQNVRIDTTVNESYDGTYAGNPHDRIAQPSLKLGEAVSAFGRQGPTRRSPVTAVLIWRSKRSSSNLPGGLHDPLSMDTEYENQEVCEAQRPFITGHNRLYHHTSTCLPIQPKELDMDSEGEGDPEWLRAKTCMMIDEFTDVNEGEKELMKMWNLHVLKHNYVGDCQMPVALDMFLQDHGEELLRRNLYRNFVLHLCNLYDFGIVGPATVLRTIASVQRILQRNPDIQETLANAWNSAHTSGSVQTS